VAQLLEDYQAGAPATELMKQYGIDKAAVLGILNEAGVTRKQRRMSNEQLTEPLSYIIRVGHLSDSATISVPPECDLAGA